eukprot:scaffold17526_cov64-Phaeocystis_antarctica.AAC.8
MPLELSQGVSQVQRQSPPPCHALYLRSEPSSRTPFLPSTVAQGEPVGMNILPNPCCAGGGRYSQEGEATIFKRTFHSQLLGTARRRRKPHPRPPRRRHHPRRHHHAALRVRALLAGGTPCRHAARSLRDQHV